MTSFTVLGGEGYIGSRLAARLRAEGHDVWVPARGEHLEGRPLGHVFYCIGVTADFRSRPFDTVEAHVCALRKVLSSCEIDSLIYLSSTRVYGTSSADADEDDVLSVAPLDSSDLYNLSKLMGESLALHSGRRCRVVRISNVVGEDTTSTNFLPDILRTAVKTGRVEFQTAQDSAKDYIHVGQVVRLLIQIAERGERPIYNVATGMNVTHRTIAERLRALRGVECTFVPDAPKIAYPRISTRRVRDEFGFQPRSLLDELPKLLDEQEA